MNIEEFREFCLHFPGTSEDCPFGPEHIVFKVKGKMFALCSIDDFGEVNLKSDPEKAIELREKYPEIRPGYHMNKNHWNTVDVLSLPDNFTKQIVEASYELVKAGLSKKMRAEIELGI